MGTQEAGADPDGDLGERPSEGPLDPARFKGGRQALLSSARITIRPTGLAFEITSTLVTSQERMCLRYKLWARIIRVTNSERAKASR